MWFCLQSVIRDSEASRTEPKQRANQRSPFHKRSNVWLLIKKSGFPKFANREFVLFRCYLIGSRSVPAVSEPSETNIRCKHNWSFVFSFAIGNMSSANAGVSLKTFNNWGVGEIIGYKVGSSTNSQVVRVWCKTCSKHQSKIN